MKSLGDLIFTPNKVSSLSLLSLLIGINDKDIFIVISVLNNLSFNKESSWQTWSVLDKTKKKPHSAVAYAAGWLDMGWSCKCKDRFVIWDVSEAGKWGLAGWLDGMTHRSLSWVADDKALYWTVGHLGEESWLLRLSSWDTSGHKGRLGQAWVWASSERKCM